MKWPTDYIPEQKWLKQSLKRVWSIRQQKIEQGFVEIERGVWRRTIGGGA